MESDAERLRRVGEVAGHQQRHERGVDSARKQRGYRHIGHELAVHGSLQARHQRLLPLAFGGRLRRGCNARNIAMEVGHLARVLGGEPRVVARRDLRDTGEGRLRRRDEAESEVELQPRGRKAVGSEPSLSCRAQLG